LCGSEKNRLDIGGGSAKSRFSAVDARHDVPLPFSHAHSRTVHWSMALSSSMNAMFMNTAVTCE